MDTTKLRLLVRLMMLQIVSLGSMGPPNGMSIFMNQTSNTYRSRKKGKVWPFITCNKPQKNRNRYPIWEHRYKIHWNPMKCFGIYWGISPQTNNPFWLGSWCSVTEGNNLINPMTLVTVNFKTQINNILIEQKWNNNTEVRSSFSPHLKLNFLPQKALSLFSMLHKWVYNKGKY